MGRTGGLDPGPMCTRHPSYPSSRFRTYTCSPEVKYPGNWLSLHHDLVTCDPMNSVEQTDLPGVFI